MRRAAFLLALLPFAGGGCEGVVCEHGYRFDGTTGSMGTGAPAECTVFVSGGSTPGQDGLSPSTPAATLEAGLVIAAQQSAPVVCVSVGLYPGVAIRQSVTVEGGYTM